MVAHTRTGEVLSHRLLSTAELAVVAGGERMLRLRECTARTGAIPRKEDPMPLKDDDRDGFGEMALMARSYQLSKMLQVAAALELADRVVDGPRSVKELASESGADGAMLLRLCRALGAFGVFTVDDDEQVAQTTRSACLPRTATSTLHHAAMYWTSPHVWKAWANLEHTVRTGECAFESVFDMPLFGYLKTNPGEAELLNLFMQHSPDDRHAAVAAAYDFSVPCVVDVGGGNGALLAAILQANLGTRGVLFDQDAVVADAHRVLGVGDLAQRCQVEVGDFFERIPSGGDIYTMSQILHDWDDERCSTILSNCRAAMGPNKRLLVIERLLEQEPGRTNPMNYLADINMMVFLHGRERTPVEFSRLLRDAGFGQPRIVHTTSPFTIVEASSR